MSNAKPADGMMGGPSLLDPSGEERRNPAAEKKAEKKETNGEKEERKIN
jgi:hypothetical protein